MLEEGDDSTNTVERREDFVVGSEEVFWWSFKRGMWREDSRALRVIEESWILLSSMITPDSISGDVTTESG